MAGALGGENLLFDESQSRWDKAAKHDAFRMALNAVKRMPLQKDEPTDPLVESVNRSRETENESSARASQVTEDSHTSFAAAVQRLDDEFAEAKRLGFDEHFLARRHQSEYTQLAAEYGIEDVSAVSERARAEGAEESADVAEQKLDWLEISGWTCAIIATMIESLSFPAGRTKAGDIGAVVGAFVAYTGVSGLILGWSARSRRFWGWGALAMLLLARYGRSG